MQEAPQIAFWEDRCSHYESLAKLSADIDKEFSKDCLREAWNETVPLNPNEFPEARRRIIDFAHRLNSDFAATLASETETDPGRDFARNQTNQQIKLLNLREKAATGEKEALTSLLQQEKSNQVEVTKMLLAGLNSGRVSSMHIENTRSFVKSASEMELTDTYTVLSWVIENAILRYENTDQAQEYLRPIYNATRLSSELTFKIASRIRSDTDSSICAARRSEFNTDCLIRPGERDKALELIKSWVSKATGFIKITDPYFGLDELEFVRLIRSVNTDIPIIILTSKKHQQDARINLPWDETYQSHWRLSLSDSVPGDVEIIVIDKNTGSGHPIHDRWWLSQKSGLRIGTSANALGGGRLSEVSDISEEETAKMLAEVDKYIVHKFGRLNNDRFSYSSFYL